MSDGYSDSDSDDDGFEEQGSSEDEDDRLGVTYLERTVRDMNDLLQHQEGESSDEPFRLWKGDEEDELADLVQHQEGEGSDEPFRLEKGGEEEDGNPILRYDHEVDICPTHFLISTT